MNILRIFKNNWFFFVFLTGCCLRFFDLNWDGIYKLHPDELNIAIAISNMGKNQYFNPDFFAYGTLPIALIFGIQKFAQIVFEITLNEYLIGRVISATLSCLSILVFYKWLNLVFARESIFKKNGVIFISTALFSTSPALIQAAHFMTFESILVFQYLIFAYFLTKLINKGGNINLILIALITGIAVATKITSIFLVPLFIITLIFTCKFNFRSIGGLILKKIIIFILFSVVTAVVFSPYSILYWEDYSGIIKYESQVANGDLRVFYTKQFTQTFPIIYHIRSVLPFVTGSWINILLCLVGLFSLTINNKFYNNKKFLLIPLFFLLVGWVPASFLFVKWIRYSTYFAPYFILFSSLGFLYLLNKVNHNKFLITVFYLFINLLLTLNFMQIYFYNDTRITAAKWAENNIATPSGRILSESYDLGIIPFNNNFMNKIDLFNFYNLNTEVEIDELASQLIKSDYIISPSQRLWANKGLLKGSFSRNYYSSLQDGSLGFELIYSSQIKTSSGIIGYDQMKLEETYSVFDHPIVNIYKKNKVLNKEEYIDLIKNEN